MHLMLFPNTHTVAQNPSVAPAPGALVTPSDICGHQARMIPMVHKRSMLAGQLAPGTPSLLPRITGTLPLPPAFMWVLERQLWSSCSCCTFFTQRLLPSLAVLFLEWSSICSPGRPQTRENPSRLRCEPLIQPLKITVYF